MGGQDGRSIVINSTGLSAANPTDVYIDGPISKSSGGPTVTWVNGSKLAAKDPLRRGYVSSFLGVPSMSAETWEGINVGKAVRAFGASIITKIGLHVTVSSGNIDVGVAVQGTQAGRLKAPSTLLTSTGSTPCPAAGYVEITLPSATPVNHGDYFVMACDNATATFMSSATSTVTQSSLGAPEAFRRSASFPLATYTWGTANGSWHKVPRLIGVE